jgi:primosomal protein N''
MNKLHQPASSPKLHQYAFLSTRLLNQISVAGFHPVAKVDEDQSGRQGNEARTQDAIRLDFQRTGKVSPVLFKEVAFPNKRLWKCRTQFGNVIRKLAGHPFEVFSYPGIRQFLDGFESTFKRGILVGG